MRELDDRKPLQYRTEATESSCHGRSRISLRVRCPWASQRNRLQDLPDQPALAERGVEGRATGRQQPSDQPSWNSPNMANFSVGFSNGELLTFTGGEAKYDVGNDNGVLTVLDGRGRRFHFSPTSWHSVEDAVSGGFYADAGAVTV